MFLLIDDRVNKKIDQLDEYEAKIMLKATYGMIETAITGNGGDEMVIKIMHRLSEIYKRIPDMEKLRNG